MSLFRKKKQAVRSTYAPQTLKPVLRCSICSGEQIAGFTNLKTGKFEEVTVIHSREELQQFMEEYGIREISKEY